MLGCQHSFGNGNKIEKIYKSISFIKHFKMLQKVLANKMQHYKILNMK